MGASGATPTSPFLGETLAIAGAEVAQAHSVNAAATPRVARIQGACAPKWRTGPTLCGAGCYLAHVVGQRGELAGIDEHDRKLRDTVHGRLDIITRRLRGQEQLLDLLG